MDPARHANGTMGTQAWNLRPVFPGVDSPMSVQSPDALTSSYDEQELLAVARDQVLEQGIPLDEAQILAVLKSSDELLPDLLALAHDVRMKWCGPEIEVEGIVSIKTGGCPEDCHFCSQSGRFETSVRAPCGSSTRTSSS